MFLARVIGTVVSTMEHSDLDGRKLLIVDRINLDGTSAADSQIAVDSVNAGDGDTVLVIDEGSSAALILGLPNPPIRTVIVGVVDHFDVEV